MFNYDQMLADFAGQTVLCVGDLMLDDYVYGGVSRISPEAPAPVIAVRRNQIVVGGAGNVARNVASLGARCVFVGVIGADDAGGILKSAFAAEKRIDARLVVDRSRVTTRKVRFVSEHHSTHLLRADWEDASGIAPAIAKAVIKHALDALPHAGALVLSDYAKGVLTPEVVRALIDAAVKRGLPVVVDPKGKDYSLYRGATLITPNRQELADATHRPATTSDEVASAAAGLARDFSAQAVLVTRSEEGMTLAPANGEAVHVPAYRVRVRDVSGAGDTVVAAIATMLAAGAEFEPAMRVANAAAAVAVGKPGTAVVEPMELREYLLPAASRADEEKIAFDWALLDRRLADWRVRGLRVGFTNGVFDLLHPGHIKVLAQSRAACDRLVVGLNSDASVKRLKGAERPMQDEHARAEVLAALEAVDLVAIFTEDTPLALIERVRPNVLVKGGDYRPETVVGREIVEAAGGEVIIVPLVAGHSTTSLIAQSRKKF